MVQEFFKISDGVIDVNKLKNPFMMAVTVRLKSEDEKRLDNLARLAGRSNSYNIRKDESVE